MPPGAKTLCVCGGGLPTSFLWTKGEAKSWKLLQTEGGRPVPAPGAPWAAVQTTQDGARVTRRLTGLWGQCDFSL